MDIIRKFQHSPWSKKGKTIIKDPAKMALLLGKLHNYMGKGGLASIREDLVVVYNYVKDVVGGRYHGYSSGNLTLIVGAIWSPLLILLPTLFLLVWSMMLLSSVGHSIAWVMNWNATVSGVERMSEHWYL